MNVFITPKFKKSYDKLPQNLQKKVKKTIELLKQDFFYPSLHTKKMEGKTSTWEARVDKSYRTTFQKEQDTITLLTVGPHDAGLGKK